MSKSIEVLPICEVSGNYHQTTGAELDKPLMHQTQNCSQSLTARHHLCCIAAAEIEIVNVTCHARDITPHRYTIGIKSGRCAHTIAKATAAFA